ncbi:hypothetical protein EW146_g738 [Bondarzewia mesenterica]|uniref:Amine oxidase domain-containing protein n=1 Tax=Bondarzewia mesenterica TaxID=1095465 RepID=A0A4V3XGB2_9AGAM|nr:hypothetical protein EW146_g738 [Bondarzewia mesenterica]
MPFMSTSLVRCLYVLVAFCAAPFAPTKAAPLARNDAVLRNPQVLILGGGVAGIIAARTLHEKGLDNFLVVEARSELGGRMKSFEFGVPGNQVVLELGANWIQGTQVGDGPANPILTLARKHNLTTQVSDFYDSMTTYDINGRADYLDEFNTAIDAYTNLTIAAGARIPNALVDTTVRTGYSLINSKPETAREMACEYYMFDWEYAQTPEQSSWIASSWGNNFTYDIDHGGFSDDNLLSIDQRGFSHLIKGEAAEFLTEKQLLLNSTVKSIKYSNEGVTATLVDGTKLSADYAILTFSLGVLQNDDVEFEPFALYADQERGRYPVWQSLDLEGFFSGSGIVFVTVTGDYSERIEALPDSQIQDEVLGVLRAMYPNTTIPDPIAFHFPRWHSDPLYRGSYSNWPASLFSDHHKNLRATLKERLWFSGEAMSQKYFGLSPLFLSLPVQYIDLKLSV